jgi:plasmid stabilization system protein ParE
MRLRWTEQARRDLLDIGRRIAADKPAVARRWVERDRRRARAATTSDVFNAIAEPQRQQILVLLPGGPVTV